MKLRRGKKVRKVEGKNKRKAPTDKGKKNKVGTNARKINEEYERTGWREVSTAIGILFVSRWRSRSKDKEDIIWVISPIEKNLGILFRFPNMWASEEMEDEIRIPVSYVVEVKDGKPTIKEKATGLVIKRDTLNAIAYAIERLEDNV
ncbi:hypothetical protein [Candidatus Methanodesulfokora washburnensis]|jgi:hypothetical protein|uniref:Uncharacterized protein n=1 Tax=Candidatus Methanodesulfokora washburnensis TaxID=2478471 RepID=A0A429GWR4_9CREN|nr:hypothetical protein [Candidatus Methanodesulfokores washburnensis]RSN78401.1 hypothetical protein D6D85_01045 [Candidatus Methanodesulfokores washburnensis]